MKASRLRDRLILSFALVALLNGAAGAYCLLGLGTLGNRLEEAYGRALVTGVYAETARFDFVRFDREVERALGATAPVEAGSRLETAARLAGEARGDLTAVEQRALNAEIRELCRDAAERIDRALTIARELAARPHDLAAWRVQGGSADVETLLARLSEAVATRDRILRNQAESETALLGRLGRAALAVALAATLILLGLLLRGTLPALRRLGAAAASIAAGGPAVRADVGARDELGEAGRAIDTLLDRAGRRERDFRSLLDAQSDAVFIYGESGELAAERSPGLGERFPGLERVRTVGDFFATYFAEAGVTILQRAQMLWQAGLVADESLVLGLMPARGRMRRGEGEARHFEFKYHPQRTADGHIERVIMVARDVTEEADVTREREAQRSQTARILSVGKLGLPRFRADYYERIERVAARLRAGGNPAELALELHSLKGALGTMGFLECAELVHAVERRLEGNDGASSVDVLTAWVEFRRLFDEQLLALGKVLRAERDDDPVPVAADKRRRLREAAQRLGDPALSNLAESIGALDFAAAFDKYPRYLEQLDREFAERRCAIRIEAPGVEISPVRAAEIDRFLVHLVRNSLAHGIEPVYERAMAGKEAEGLLVLTARALKDGGLVLDYFDDGRGLPIERLREVAVARKRWTSEQAAAAPVEKVAALIFEAGISTRVGATAAAGFGIGMYAVRTQVKRMGGSLALRSEPGRGTHIRVTLPPETATASAPAAGSQPASAPASAQST